MIEKIDKAAHLRTDGYWVGTQPRADIVSNLYDADQCGMTTPERWNKYGSAAKAWDQQNLSAILQKNPYYCAIIEVKTKIIETMDDKLAKKELDIIEKKTGLAIYNTVEGMASDLKGEGYWVGKDPRKDVVIGLYGLDQSNNMTPEVWNKYGRADKPWDQQKLPTVMLKMEMKMMERKIDGQAIIIDEPKK